MTAQSPELPKLRVWLEYACPWSYLAAVRLRPLAREYRGRVEVEYKALPLEWVNDHPTPRNTLEQEWWIAALHEPAAKFAPYTADTYPDSTLSAFEAWKCASMQGADEGFRYDLLLRQAFFGRSMDISKREALLALAQEAGLDTGRFAADLDSGQAARLVRADYEEGAAFLDPTGTPSFVLPDNTQTFNPAAAKLEFRAGRIIGLTPMPCLGGGCSGYYRNLLDLTYDQRPNTW